MRKYQHFIFIFFVFISRAQTLSLDNVFDFSKRNIGSLVDDNNSRTHYVLYEKFDTVQQKVKKQVITFFDESLTVNHNEENVYSTESNLFALYNNKSHLMAAFHDKKAELVRFKVYNSKGLVSNTVEFDFDKRLFYPYLNYYYKLVFPIDNKGFLVNQIVKKKHLGYNITFVNNIGESSWVYKSPADHDNRKEATPLFANDQVVILSEKEWGSNYDHKPTFNIIVLDSKTGKVIFTKSKDYEVDPDYYTNAFVTNQGEVLLFGELFEQNNSMTKNDYNIGYFFEKFDLTGQQIKSNILRFNDERFKTLVGFDKVLDQDDFGTIYFNSIKEYDGDYYFVGQIVRRSKQGNTFGKQILSAAIGGAVGGAISNNWQSTYELKEIVLMKVDENLNLMDCTLLPKTVTHTGLNSLVARPQYNLMEMEYHGRLDFVNHQVYKDGQIVVYKTHERSGDIDKLLLKKAVFKEGRLDFLDDYEVSFDKNESYYALLPYGQSGSLMFKYNYELKRIQVIKNAID
ncbi:DUF6770 family protein [Flavobacterium sp. TBRC 19031]|uniref:DUF6770 family protein n=1 Tax=Flavobacterium mekongense TaxID=3379707 RepID=UPI00399996A0